MEPALSSAASARCRQTVIVGLHTWANLQESQWSWSEHWEGGPSSKWALVSPFHLPHPTTSQTLSAQAWETAGAVCVCVCVTYYCITVIIHAGVFLLFVTHHTAVCDTEGQTDRPTDRRMDGVSDRQTGSRETGSRETDRTAESCQWWNEKHHTHAHQLTAPEDNKGLKFHYIFTHMQIPEHKRVNTNRLTTFLSVLSPATLIGTDMGPCWRQLLQIGWLHNGVPEVLHWMGIW